jgi:hypothetical protein
MRRRAEIEVVEEIYEVGCENCRRDKASLADLEVLAHHSLGTDGMFKLHMAVHVHCTK